ncbi:MAG: helix-turn-helix transcriptional regulator [Pseudomonadota bacterium]
MEGDVGGSAAEPAREANLRALDRMLDCETFDEAAVGVIQPVANVLHATSGVILRFKSSPIGDYVIEAASHQLSRSTVNDYTAGFFGADPLAHEAFSMRALERIDLGREVLPLYGVVDAADFIRTPYYNDFLQAHGLGDIMAMYLQVPGLSDDLFCLALQRWSDRERFSASELRQFFALRPLVSASFAKIAVSEAMAFETQSQSAASDPGMSCGVSVWDEHVRLIYASPVAVEDLKLDHPEALQAWRGWLRASVDDAHETHGDRFSVVTQHKGFAVDIQGVRAGDRPRYTVTTRVSSFARALAPLAGEAGLTPREAQICQAIATGLTNENIAHQFNVSVKTVQNHIVAVFAKLSVHSRTQLIARVMGWEWQGGETARHARPSTLPSSSPNTAIRR